MNRISLAVRFAAATIFCGAFVTFALADNRDDFLRDVFDLGVRYSRLIEFPGLVSQQHHGCDPNCPIPPPDANLGRLNFGFNAAQTDFDNTQALFQGQSVSIGAPNITSNGRTCAICHRPDSKDSKGNIIDELNLGLPHTVPLSSVIPLSDPLFTGHEADDAEHPDGFYNLNNHALIAIKPGRF